MQPADPDIRLRRAETAAALTAAGFPISKATLATLAVRGGGPNFQRFGRVPLYRWGDALAWAHGRMTPPAATTAEHATAQGHTALPD